MRAICLYLLAGFLALSVTALTVDEAQAVRLTVDQPGEREFVRDQADMLSAGDEQKIKELADKLLTEHATPIIVITIESMAKYGGADLSIESFAMLLFNQWGIGVKELGGQQWNTGILLLVSRDDRQARIELGAGWGREKDDLAAQIMEDQIIARFKQNDFSGGIVAGVESLDAMARDKPLPRVPRPWWHYAVVLGAVALFIFTIVSLIRRGASGWAWVFWAAVFALLGVLIYNLLRNSSSGGFSGGSFGGGSSGGGGASGSW